LGIPIKVTNRSCQKLKPHIIALTPDERRAIPKMSDKTLPFMEKTLDYYQAAPQFAPPFFISRSGKSIPFYYKPCPVKKIFKRAKSPRITGFYDPGPNRVRENGVSG
jgi:hypothetical protein